VKTFSRKAAGTQRNTYFFLNLFRGENFAKEELQSEIEQNQKPERGDLNQAAERVVQSAFGRLFAQ